MDHFKSVTICHARTHFPLHLQLSIILDCLQTYVINSDHFRKPSVIFPIIFRSLPTIPDHIHSINFGCPVVPNHLQHLLIVLSLIYLTASPRILFICFFFLKAYDQQCNIFGLECLNEHYNDLAVLRAKWTNRTGLVCNCIPSCTEIEMSTIRDYKQR